MEHTSQSPHWEWIAQQAQATQFSVEIQDLNGLRIGVYTLLEALEPWMPQKPSGIDRLFGPLLKREHDQQQGD